ncbi:hypothetical protein Purlil1_788 [Purpureocillium lilacinum]|uniref:Uncharacterized protein n=1 Tax=Purpureocillium lilacinum TaxID=33203 RepID=A0ABR0CF99_PURLI|nr:hypothetical protein Purlil1_788 [Purpureocillium lilacinum]
MEAPARSPTTAGAHQWRSALAQEPESTPQKVSRASPVSGATGMHSRRTTQTLGPVGVGAGSWPRRTVLHYASFPSWCALYQGAFTSCSFDIIRGNAGFTFQGRRVVDREFWARLQSQSTGHPSVALGPRPGASTLATPTQPLERQRRTLGKGEGGPREAFRPPFRGQVDDETGPERVAHDPGWQDGYGGGGGRAAAAGRDMLTYAYSVHTYTYTPSLRSSPSSAASFTARSDARKDPEARERDKSQAHAPGQSRVPNASSSYSGRRRGGRELKSTEAVTAKGRVRVDETTEQPMGGSGPPGRLASQEMTREGLVFQEGPLAPRVARAAAACAWTGQTHDDLPLSIFAARSNPVHTPARVHTQTKLGGGVVAVAVAVADADWLIASPHASLPSPFSPGHYDSAHSASPPTPVLPPSRLLPPSPPMSCRLQVRIGLVH